MSSATLAPELAGAIDLIKYLVEQKIVVSLGHSNATKSEAIEGFNAGAKTVTHLFNAMSKPPAQGLSDAAIERKDVIVQVIVDGVHVSDELLSQTLPKIMDRFIITNDAVALVFTLPLTLTIPELFKVKDPVFEIVIVLASASPVETIQFTLLFMITSQLIVGTPAGDQLALLFQLVL